MHSVRLEPIIQGFHDVSFFFFQSSFGDIARVLSEFFRDLDVVPTDVIVGLVLLRQRQQMIRLRVVNMVSEEKDIARAPMHAS